MPKFFLRVFLFLTKCNNDLNLALDHYFANKDKYLKKQAKLKSKQQLSTQNNNSGGTPASNSFNKNIKHLFKKYEDPDQKNMITVDGILQLCEDLDLDPTSRPILLLAFYLNAKQQGQFTYNEFFNGLYNLGVDSIDKLKSKLLNLNSNLDSVSFYEDFKKLYLFTFDYARDPKQKSLDIEETIIYLKMLFTKEGDYNEVCSEENIQNCSYISSTESAENFPNFNLLLNFLKFLEYRIKEEKLAIMSRDQWNLLIDFGKNAEANIQKHNDLDAWPVMVDEYFWGR